jgi:hypothetical protein
MWDDHTIVGRLISVAAERCPLIRAISAVSGMHGGNVSQSLLENDCEITSSHHRK